jgi:hypothetical protein
MNSVPPLQRTSRFGYVTNRLTMLSETTVLYGNTRLRYKGHSVLHTVTRVAQILDAQTTKIYTMAPNILNIIIVVPPTPRIYSCVSFHTHRAEDTR